MKITREGVAGLVFGLGAGTVLGYYFWVLRRDGSRNGDAREHTNGATHKNSEDSVDRASEESFPASDSPAY